MNIQSAPHIEAKDICRVAYKAKKGIHNNNCPSCKNEEYPIPPRDEQKEVAEFWGERKHASFHCGFCGAFWTSGVMSDECD